MGECQNNKGTNHLQSHGTIYPGFQRPSSEFIRSDSVSEVRGYYSHFTGEDTEKWRNYTGS